MVDNPRGDGDLYPAVERARRHDEGKYPLKTAVVVGTESGVCLPGGRAPSDGTSGVGVPLADPDTPIPVLALGIVIEALRVGQVSQESVSSAVGVCSGVACDGDDQALAEVVPERVAARVPSVDGGGGLAGGRDGGLSVKYDDHGTAQVGQSRLSR